jgi:hypothetical protein
MPVTLGELRDRFLRAFRRVHLSALPLLLATLASAASAQQIIPPSPTATCPVGPDATYPDTPETYPKMSDRYAVQYKLGDEPGWTDARVYISEYGETEASPARSDSGYTAGVTSMSFVSIPAGSNTSVQLRVTLLSGSPNPGPIPFLAGDRVSVRPTVKGIFSELMGDGTIHIVTGTGNDFGGEQFILSWNRSESMGGGIQGLAFFLDPIYTVPAGTVKTIRRLEDLHDLDGYDTLDFEGKIAIGGTGDVALAIPANILNVYLGPDAWVQGKFQFVSTADVGGVERTITGPGVLDVSRFQYNLRSCGSGSDYPDQGEDALVGPPGDSLNDFDIEGIIVSDTNHAATAPLFNTTVKNVKTMSWNGVNGGLKIEDNSTVSNVFVRAGNDSLMVWGSYITVTNATVWQDYNGGVVNLGWSNNSGGDGCLVDGLYVVKTDWTTPTDPTFSMGPTFSLNHQNNAVIASMMVPGTKFGTTKTSTYKNIFVEDRPQVLLSLKILPPECDLTSFDGGCPNPVDLTQQSHVYLNIENLFTPFPIEENSIGFETLLDYPNPGFQPLSEMYTLGGTINVNLTNVFLLGKVATNGAGVNVKYGFAPLF